MKKLFVSFVLANLLVACASEKSAEPEAAAPAPAMEAPEAAPAPEPRPRLRTGRPRPACPAGGRWTPGS